MFRPFPAIRFLGGLAVLLGAPAPAAAQAQHDDQSWVRKCEKDYDDDDRVRFCEVRHLGFRFTGGALSIQPDQNGGVKVEGWDRDSVAIAVRIQASASSREDAQELARQVSVRAGSGLIEVDGPSSGRHQSWSASLVVRVPRKTDLESRTTNGPLSVEGLSGRIELRATNGPVSLASMSGQVRARVQNGPLSVWLDGRSWDGAGLDAETVNGPVTLAIPEGYNAELETGTVNGPMQFDVPLTVTLQGRVRDRIRTTLGSGGSPIRVVTTNGPITIRRPER